MTPTLIIVGVIAIIVAYIVGRVSGVPNYLPCQQTCNYPYCNCPRPLPLNCVVISRTEIDIIEKQAYIRGKYEGILETKSDIQYTKFMSLSDQEKFLKRFNECIKPLEELKENLKEGKF